jgi:glyoxylase-like metal-dependent hydrolase (beta-lactamase superfamily II)
MAMIPLEDTFTDILGKAQRGLKLSDEQLAQRAGVSLADLGDAKSGMVNEAVLRRLAPPLNLGADALVKSANKAWYPRHHQLEGLAPFNTAYQDMTVNSYLVWDPTTTQAAAFDTGASSVPMLDYVKTHGLRIKLLLLTHTHPDHIADLATLRSETGAPVHVSRMEPIPGAETFTEGKSFTLGRLTIETRQTSGHSAGGITYVINGLSRPLAVVGDAIFAGSMGGGGVSYADALANNRKNIFTLPEETILCPGHGPLTTVGEEKQANPFYPEYHKR